MHEEDVEDVVDVGVCEEDGGDEEGEDDLGDVEDDPGEVEDDSEEAP